MRMLIVQRIRPCLLTKTNVTFHFHIQYCCHGHRWTQMTLLCLHGFITGRVGWSSGLTIARLAEVECFGWGNTCLSSAVLVLTLWIMIRGKLQWKTFHMDNTGLSFVYIYFIIIFFLHQCSLFCGPCAFI